MQSSGATSDRHRRGCCNCVDCGGLFAALVRGYRRLRAETILHKCVCIALIAAVQESCSASPVSD